MLKTTNILDKKRFEELKMEFKKSLNDKNKQPTWVDYYGVKTKEKGYFSLFTFIFYAVIRGSDYKRAVHSVESDKYQRTISYFTDEPVKGDYYFMHSQNQELSNLKKVFPSLKDSEIEKVKNYFKQI